MWFFCLTFHFHISDMRPCHTHNCFLTHGFQVPDVRGLYTYATLIAKQIVECLLRTRHHSRCWRCSLMNTQTHSLPSQSLNSRGSMHCTAYPIFCRDALVCFVLFQVFLLLLTVVLWTRWPFVLLHWSLCRAVDHNAEGIWELPGEFWKPSVFRACLQRLCFWMSWKGPENWGFLQTPPWFYWVICSKT